MHVQRTTTLVLFLVAVAALAESSGVWEFTFVEEMGYVVDTAADSGPGSLRQAIELADGDGAASTITFDPSLAGQTIVLQEPLPPLSSGGTTIDGDLDGDCVPDVALSGELLPDAAGLEVRSSNNVIRGLAIHSFSWAAIQLWGQESRADGNVIECNHLGTGFTATENLGNGDAGVRLTGGASDNLIARNVIAHNATEGVLVLEEPGDTRFPEFDVYPVAAAGVYPVIDFDTGFDCGPFENADGSRPVKADGTFFYGNFGLRLSGTLSVDATDDYEIRLDNAARRVAIYLDGQPVVEGGCCGGQLSTVETLAAGDHDLLIAAELREPENRLRLEVDGLGGGSANLSSGGEPGLYAEFYDVRGVSEGNTISRNSIFNNGEIGIDLDWCLVQPNDPGDVDVGANTLLNHPVLTGFGELGGDDFEVAGTATPESTVELFAVAEDPNIDHGEGKEYLGQAAADVNGDFTTTVALPAGYTTVTATATDTAGNTSEYARNLGLRPYQITVGSLADGGPGSLREAMEQAEVDGAPTIITFDPSMAGQKIVLQEMLPQLFEGETTIDADLDGDCVPDVEISGELLGEGEHGLDVGSSGNVIRGLAITRFPASGIQLSGAWDNVVGCTYVGVDLAGEAAGNQNEGIQLNHDASRNRIGPGNVIAHNGQGLAVRDGWTDDYPSFTGVTPDASGVYPAIDFTDDCGGYFRYADGTLILDGEGRPFRDAIGARFTATLTVDAPGIYLFEIEELRDNARLKIDGLTVLDEECCGYYSTTVSLAQGDHDLELAFHDGGMAQVKLDVTGPDNASLSAGGGPGVLAEFFKMRVPSEQNTITQSSFYANGNGQAIAFGFCGYVQNDPGDLDDGPNTLLNHPDLTGGEDLGGGLYRVSGTATPSSTVEVYAAEPNPNGPGGGQEYLTSVTADLNGDFTVDVTLPAEFNAVTATATDGDGNTSQFSAYLGLAPRQISVTSATDGGPGSLRDAIEQANGDGGPTLITFEPSMAGSTIELYEALPVLEEDETVIDGDLDGDCVPDVAISGELLPDAAGLEVRSSNNVIRGLAIHSFSWAAIQLWGSESRVDGNVIECNHLGTGFTATEVLGNGDAGVRLTGGGSDNLIARNVIAHNATEGVLVLEEPGDTGFPEFDVYPVETAGVFPLIDFDTTFDCAPFESADGIRPVKADGTFFYGNFGLRLNGSLSVDADDAYQLQLDYAARRVRVWVDSQVVLAGQCCGEELSAVVPLAAGDYDLLIAVEFREPENRLRLEVEGLGGGSAWLSSEGSPGLYGELYDVRNVSERNTIRENAIFDNGEHGIDLDWCWIQPNDPGDVDVGANTVLNHPELTLALADAGGTTIEGVLDTPSPELATVELFASSLADPSGYGEGESYLASVLPDPNGTFSAVVSELAAGEVVTATATDAAGNTSEFSLALRVTQTVRWATALYAAAQSSNSIRLTWADPDKGETGFRVERSADGSTWLEIATVGGDATSHLDAGLASATLYYYRLVAFAGGADERASNVAWATTFPASAATVCHQQVTTTHRGARLPSPAWNGDSWAVVWMERGGAYDELYFQLLDAGGAPQGTPRRLTESDSITQLPTLRWNGSSFGLIYGEHMRGPDGQFWSNTKFARLAADGTPIRKEVVLDAGQLGAIPNQFDEALVWDGSHWGWLALRAYDFPASDANEVGYYRLSVDGDVVLGPIRLTSTAENEMDVSAAWNGGEYGIAWIEQGNSQRVLFQRMQSDGVLLGAAVEIGATGGYLLGTSVVWDGGGWAVSWSESQDDGSEAVQLRQLDPLGVPLAAAERISDDYDQEFGPGMPVFDEYPQLLAKPGGYAIYTLSYSIATGGWEIGRLEAGAVGNRVGQRQFVSDRDGLHSLWNRVATDGSHDLIAYNEHRQGTQEIAAVVIDPAGTIASGPVDLTSGHDPGVSTAWTVGSFNPQVVPVGGGFAALWRDVLGGGQIHTRIYDSSGAPAASRVPLTAGTVAGGPVAVGVGDSFAVAWLDGDSGQVTFDRYDAAGYSILGEVQLDGGGVPEAIAFSGEVYGVVWRQGSGIALQTVTPEGAVVDPPATIAGAGNQLIRMQWTGAGWAIVARAGSDLTYTLLDTGGAFLVPPAPITGTPAAPGAVDLEWTGEHLGLTWSEDRDFDGDRQIFFTVLDLGGGKAFPDTELWSKGRNPTLFWQSGSFHVVFRNFHVDSGANLQVEVLPNGDVLPGSRALSAHLGIGHAAGNGVTAGFLYGHRAEMYFETTACLDDTTPPPAPELSALYDGLKVSLDWTPVSDPESTIIGYNLYRDGAMIAESFATTFSYADHGVVAAAVYLYELRAMNGAFLESAGDDGIVTVAIATTVEGVGEAMETAATAAFEQAIEDILADPAAPDGAADEVQDALDDVIGNNGGSASNGAVDKLDQGLIVPALVKMRQAIEELQDGAALGYDTGDLQLLVTSFARLAVLAVIQINAEVHGAGHADVVAARVLFDQGDALLAAGDYLRAIDVYKDAVQALP